MGDGAQFMDRVKSFCIQLADTIFRNKYRKIEHRRFIRLGNTLTVHIRLVDCDNNRPYSKPISGSTVNISKEGMCIESSTATVDGVDIFNDAMSPEKCLEMEIVLPESSGGNIKACGKVVWLDMTPRDRSFLFKCGVQIDLQKCSDREGWYAFVNQAKKMRRSQSWLLRKFSNILK